MRGASVGAPPERLPDTAADQVKRGRREAIIRLAKYTAPAMLAMLLSQKAMASV